MREILRQQQRECLEHITSTEATLRRLKKLVREQATYEPEAFEESANALLGELAYHGRRFAARMSIVVALRCGRVMGLPPKSE
jgi:hypothetical protein